MAVFFEGVIVGVLLGLVMRPILDAYLLHRMQIEAAEGYDRNSRFREPVLQPRADRSDHA